MQKDRLIFIALGALLGTAFSSSGMEFANKSYEKTYGTIKKQDQPTKTGEPGCFSYLLSLFSTSEQLLADAESTKLLKDSPQEKRVVPFTPTINRRPHYQKLSHQELIASSLEHPHARDVLIDRLYNSLIPFYLINTINFEKLIEDRLFVRPGIPMRTNQLYYKVIVILVTHMPCDSWPKDLYEYIERRADEQNREAQYLLGFLYFNGKYVPKNLNLAQQFFKKSADNEYPSSLNYLGFMYSKGLGVEKDPYWAGYYYRQAVAQGHVLAKRNLGCLYEKGEGVGQDYNKATDLYLQSSDQGNEDAQLNRAHLYEIGKIVGPDINDAIQTYLRLAEQGNDKAQYRLGLLYKEGCAANNHGVEKNPELALKYFKLAADQGHRSAQMELGDLYHGQKEDDLSSKYLRLAANQGNSEELYDLAILCKNGKGVQKNLTLAAEFFQKSADQGHSVAQYEIGRLYKKGRGVKKNPELAKKYFLKSAEQGNSNAQCEMGLIYKRLIGKKNQELAAEWLIKSADQENSEALYQIALLYKNGSNDQKAFIHLSSTLHSEDVPFLVKKYLYKSAEKGNLKAKYDLGVLFSISEKVYTYINNIGRIEAGVLIKYIEYAANEGNSNAQYKLGRIYKNKKLSYCDHAEVCSENCYYTEFTPPNDHSAYDLFVNAALQGHEEAFRELKQLNPVEHLKLVMMTAHEGNLNSRNTFSGLITDHPDLTAEIREKQRDLIDAFMGKINVIDAAYIAMGAMAAEGNCSSGGWMGDSFKDLFRFVPNPHFAKMTLELSQSLEGLREKLPKFHEAGTEITCFNATNDLFKSLERTSLTYQNNTIKTLSFNGVRLLKSDFDPYEAKLKEILSFQEKVCGFMKDINQIDLNLKNITGVLNMLKRSEENLPLFDYLSCYFSYMPKDEQPTRQILFLKELNEYFTGYYILETDDYSVGSQLRTKMDLRKVSDLKDEYEELTVLTSPYRNKLFLDYLGL